MKSKKSIMNIQLFVYIFSFIFSASPRISMP